MSQTRWSVLIVLCGLLALIATGDAMTVLFYALVAVPAVACIWRPDIFHRLGEVLAISVFERSGSGLINESAHIVGWLLLVTWCVFVGFEVLWSV